MNEIFHKPAVLLTLITITAGIACSATPGAKPQTQPATTTAPAADAESKKILDRLEQAGQKYQTVQADVKYHVLMRELGDSETRTGQVKFKLADKNHPARFYIRFDTLRQGAGRKLADKVEYAFDGQWLTEAKHRVKQMTRYQVAAKGERADPLKLGRGPFPIPFGQRAEDVIKHFKVTTRETKKTDPKNTDYLKLIRRKAYSDKINFTHMEMWIDRKTNLPVKVVSRDKNKDVTTVTFTNVKTNRKFDDKTFHLPRKLGWEYRVKRLTDKTPK